MLTSALLTALLLQPSEVRLMRYPDVHGDTVVFAYAGDLWTVDKKDGVARHLTTFANSEAYPRFSPDGQWIAFTGSYDGNADVYVIPSTGGEPKRLTYDPEQTIVLDWTPDGKIAYASGAGCHSDRFMRLWMIDPKGGHPQWTSLQEISSGSFSPDGKNIAYDHSGSQNFNWRRYRGGTQGQIEFFNLNTNAYSKIAQGKENNWDPMWIGDSVYYISDRDFGTKNLFKFSTGNKRVERITDFKDSDIKNPKNDANSIVWERDGYLEQFDIRTQRVTKVQALIPGDFLNARPKIVNVTSSIQQVALSPSGARLTVGARGDIFSVPAKNGETRNMTQSQGIREQNPDWSPDGQTVSFISDERGEPMLVTMPQMGGDKKFHKVDPLINGYVWADDSKKIAYTTSTGKLCIYEVETGKETLVVQSEVQATPIFDWAPDGSWIAYIKAGDNLIGNLYLYNVATNKSTKVSEGFFSDDQVTFDQNGKYLYMISSRTFYPVPGAFEFMMNMGNPQRAYLLALTKDSPNPLLQKEDEEPVKSGDKPKEEKPEEKDTSPGLKIDLDGLANRIMPLPFQPGQVGGVIGVNNGVLTIGADGLLLFSLNTRSAMPIYQGPLAGLGINAKRNKMVINTGQGLTIMPISPGADPNAGRVNTGDLIMNWDPKAEWKQIFWESWRWERDVFYDKNMLGLDWKAIGDKYAAYLPYLNHRSDLNYVLGLMIGELGTGHAYVGGGDAGATVPGISIGQLGCDYSYEGKFVRIAKIYPGASYEEESRSPLTDLGVQVKQGDYLLSIDGNAVTSDSDPNKFLVAKANRWVTIKVNDKPSMDGARSYRVRPVGSEAELRYRTWVDENRKKVEMLSNGRIGYVHVPDTSIPGVVEFIRGFYSQTDKDAWIIDERYNGGGMIPTFFIEFLQREYVAKMKARDWKDIGFPVGTWEGPKAMLINEYAGSGGDMLPWLFSEAKLGPLIGERTWGGLVGIQGSAPLVDGGFLTSPGFGIYDHKKGKWIAENTGVSPDIDVDQRPDLVAKGSDPQLEAGVKYLLDQLKKASGKTDKIPDFIKPKPGQ